ncbi:C2H2 zinc finger [Ceratobasidium sp. AG-Ba]|nr:C2H2 zinc finger [Ceratobasidium sp. AG-Ba]
MAVDSPRHQSLPSIKALFGIGQHDDLSSIATLPATERSALLEPPRTPLAHFSLSDLQGSLPMRPRHPTSRRHTGLVLPTATRQAPDTKLGPHRIEHIGSHPRPPPQPTIPAPRRPRPHEELSDASSAYDYSESERQDCHVYPPSLAALATQSHHPSMAIGARAPPSSSATREAAAHTAAPARSPLVPSSSKAPGEAGFGGEHVLMRVHAPAVHGEGYEFTKEFLAAKYECQYCGKRFNRPSSLKIHVNTIRRETVPFHHAAANSASCPTCADTPAYMPISLPRVHHNPRHSWRGVSVSGSEDDEELDLRSESSVGGSPRMRGVGGNGSVRRSSPLARMHPYAVREVSPAGGGGAGEAQSGLFRLPLVPHYG